MIRITFIASAFRAAKEYDTDDTQEALSEEVAKWFKGSGRELPNEATMFAVLIERDDYKMPRAEIAEKLRDIASMEEARAYDAGVRAER